MMDMLTLNSEDQRTSSQEYEVNSQVLTEVKTRCIELDVINLSGSYGLRSVQACLPRGPQSATKTDPSSLRIVSQHRVFAQALIALGCSRAQSRSCSCFGGQSCSTKLHVLLYKSPMRIRFKYRFNKLAPNNIMHTKLRATWLKPTGLAFK